MNRELFTHALREADNVRMELGLNMYQPVNIYDICTELGITVRFVDINMEGMYIAQESGNFPTILISNQRPYPRRCYTCAHELGHHRFNHGTKVDVLSDQSQNKNASSDIEEEILVDAFAGALLMPILGIQAEFVKRNIEPNQATPLHYFMISSVFGTGYRSLVLHCKFNKLITPSKTELLLKYTPSTILAHIAGADIPKAHFKMLDDCSSVSVIDLEMSNYLILPPGFITEGKHLENLKKLTVGDIYTATKPGIVRAVESNSGNGFFIRIQNQGYVGLAEYRHLENNE
ncbi:MAG: ImmA/IrrE family metallo-endopeptidase [Lewinellaceae bacterium]|nr:ImmA/IrrE family metallo-endopeptidase [Saprospiraceae bacterium]MCB9338441.1 ImmA/IrrE family metallo-endopeptidase [Lewinellaceae bacterium]